MEIKTEHDYAVAIERLQLLFNSHHNSITENDELEILIEAIQTYDKNKNK